MRRGELTRRFVSLVAGILGTCGVIGLSLGMNAQIAPRVVEPVTVVETLAVAPKAAPSRKARPQRSSPAKKARASAPSPGPSLAAGLSGFAFGFGDAADLALQDATSALLGDPGGAAVDEDAVDEAPRATSRNPPSFPARARALGQSGEVTVSFVVEVDGSVQDAAVVASDPPGVFDDAALEAVRSWTFEPGRDQGLPVAVRVRQTMSFALE